MHTVYADYDRCFHPSLSQQLSSCIDELFFDQTAQMKWKYLLQKQPHNEAALTAAQIQKDDGEIIAHEQFTLKSNKTPSRCWVSGNI